MDLARKRFEIGISYLFHYFTKTRVQTKDRYVKINLFHFNFTDSLLENNNFNIITLPHPAGGKPVKYCLDDINKKIYEIISYDEPYRSWFIGETVKSDGSVQMCTTIHPIFLGKR